MTTPAFMLNNITGEIKALPVVKSYTVTLGVDNLDQIAKAVYGNMDYWHAIASYNDIISPFDLISQGITNLRLFRKEDYDKITRKL